MTAVTHGQAAQALERDRASLGKRLGLRQGDALVVVDVQRDFLPGGALGVPGGDEIIAPINAYIAAFESRRLPIFMTRDWHPENHASFKSRGGPWPTHCVRGSAGAQWADGLNVVSQAKIVSKGTDVSTDGYSGFAATALPNLLRDLAVQRLFIGGLATDYCVRATVLDARAQGFDVVLLADAMRAVNVAPGDETRALSEMLANGATLFRRSRAPGADVHPAAPMR